MTVIFTSKGEKVSIDDEDYERISKHGWWVDNRGYVRTEKRSRGRRSAILMHRFVLNLSFGDGRVVDHISGIKTDNRRCNLRICTPTQNQHNQKRRTDNTTGYKGVVFRPDCGRFRSRITINGKKKNLGLFDSAEEAHAAYCAAAIEFFGEFANFGSNQQTTRLESIEAAAEALTI
jgi:hypothetical protein